MLAMKELKAAQASCSAMFCSENLREALKLIVIGIIHKYLECTQSLSTNRITVSKKVTLSKYFYR